jgi:hypothetical protein
MWRLLVTWLGSLLLVLAFCLPAGRAQAPNPPAPAPGPAPAASPSEQGGAEGPGAFPWLVAVLCTVLILLVVCMPSRKN